MGDLAALLSGVAAVVAALAGIFIPPLLQRRSRRGELESAARHAAEAAQKAEHQRTQQLLDESTEMRAELRAENADLRLRLRELETENRRLRRGEQQ